MVGADPRDPRIREAMDDLGAYTKANPSAKRDLKEGNSSFGRGTHRPAGEYTIQNVTPPIKVPAAELMKTEETEFAFDEYAVYAANQIKHKYLVKVEIVPK
ncbi:hypothetical protein M3Y99_01109400 [Aphelenchoides fujianensis]|nr:hypothetical protein M3Y99_01109400 [Aphelenchoides fujianensis]